MRMIRHVIAPASFPIERMHPFTVQTKNERVLARHNVSSVLTYALKVSFPSLLSSTEPWGKKKG